MKIGFDRNFRCGIRYNFWVTNSCLSKTGVQRGGVNWTLKASQICHFSPCFHTYLVFHLCTFCFPSDQNNFWEISLSEESFVLAQSMDNLKKNNTEILAFPHLYRNFCIGKHIGTFPETYYLLPFFKNSSFTCWFGPNVSILHIAV